MEAELELLPNSVLPLMLSRFLERSTLFLAPSGRIPSILALADGLFVEALLLVLRRRLVSSGSCGNRPLARA